MIPFQELVHKKKCLLPDVGAAIEATGADVVIKEISKVKGFYYIISFVNMYLRYTYCC